MKKATLKRNKFQKAWKTKLASQKQRNFSEVPQSYYWWPITRAKIRQAAQKVAKEVDPEKINGQAVAEWVKKAEDT